MGSQISLCSWSLRATGAHQVLSLLQTSFPVSPCCHTAVPLLQLFPTWDSVAHHFPLTVCSFFKSQSSGLSSRRLSTALLLNPYTCLLQVYAQHLGGLKRPDGEGLGSETLAGLGCEGCLGTHRGLGKGIGACIDQA